MRIALLMDFAPRKLGSMEHWVVKLCAEAHRRGHEIRPFGRSPIHPEVARQLSAMGIRWESVDSLEASPLQTIRQLRRFDVIDLNMFTPATPVALMSYASFPARVALMDHISGKIPIDEERRALSSRGMLNRGMNRLIGTRLAGVAAVCNYVRDRDRLRFGMEDRKVRTIYNGVDLHRFHPKNGSSPTRSGLNVLCIAYLIPEKGVEYLIRAFSKIRDGKAHLSIVGDGPIENALKALAKSLGMGNRVSFLGLRNDVDELLATSDIVVHPATWTEACPYTVEEAMASGCAVIASNVGGIPELIEHGKTGLLVNPKDVVGLTDALNLLTEDAAYRRQLATNGRRSAVEQMDVNTSVEQHIDWISSLVEEPARTP
jgi:glycosyltransferase involved in cell wall biosynthesis